MAAGPRLQSQQNVAPAGPINMGSNPYPKKDKDDIRSKILRLREKYSSLCGDAPEGHRFRVRAEILPNGEDYMTVEMGCHVDGYLTIPWAEYASTDLEIRFGSQLERISSVQIMVRRSPDRLGYALSIPQALRIPKDSADYRRLLLSNKEFSRLPAQERSVRNVAPSVPPPPPSYYERESERARSEMNRLASDYHASTGAPIPEESRRPPHPSGEGPRTRNESTRPRSWSDEMDEEASSTAAQSRTPAPILEQRAGGSTYGNDSTASQSSQVRAMPTPTTRGVTPQAPAPTTSGSSKGRQAPAPSSRG